MGKQSLLFFSSCFFLFPLLSEIQGVQGSSHHHRHRHGGFHGFHPTKLFVFGDSYSDTGNNPRSGSSWNIPYGITYPGKPAGRYSDGRILTDFFAKYLGLTSPVPYTRRRANAPKLVRHGMNFAYGGTGVFDTLSVEPNMTTQISFLQNLIGESVYTKSNLRTSLSLVTVAGNDYNAYLARGGSNQDLPSFITTVVNQIAVDLKRIHNMGVKRVVVGALQPLGCLPGVTFINSFTVCNETLNAAVEFHNKLLQQAVAKLNNESKDSKAFSILDLYGSFTSVLNNNGSVKFETPLKPCCIGTSTEYSCGDVDEKRNKMYTVCDNPKAAFFWDMFHPTQVGWRNVFFALKL